MRTRYFESMERRCLFAVVVPAGFTDEPYANGLSNATAMEFAPDGRLFVTQQNGSLRVIEAEGNLLTTSFVSLDVDSVGERGLLGIAFDPSFATSGFVYVYYTVPNGPDGSSGAFNRVSRLTAVDADGNAGNGYQPGNTAVPGSESVLLTLNPLSGATNHNGGALHFGPDGKLYLAVGENANSSNAQTLNNFLGKILRMNVNGSAPADNPFNDADANPSEPSDYIWAMGLRNPFTTAFDPVTGRFHINDVGEATWEEVNEGIRGANYGWPTYEGPENDPNFGTPPIFAYTHAASGNNGGNVISGGTFYRPAVETFPNQYQGDYFFADAQRGWIRSYDVSTATAALFATGASYPVDLKTGNDGALYYLERGSGSVRRIRANLPPSPAWLSAGSAATWNGTTLTITGAATIIANPGSDAPLIVGNTSAANLTINPATHTQISIGGMTLSNGARVTLTNSASDRVLIVNAGGLSMTGTSRLDLTDNDMIIDYSGTTPAADIEADIRSGYNFGDWLGNGITSSAAAANANFHLGVADNASFAAPFGTVQGGPLFRGIDVDATTVLVKYTHRVDLNLDGRVTDSDAITFSTYYEPGASADWSIGDLNMDGLFSDDDAILFSTHYDTTLPPV
jgi:glucose/arabinose dehydrogenase